MLNEKPREDERVNLDAVANKNLGTEAVIQTDKGEIHIKLFTHECPKTVENFCVSVILFFSSRLTIFSLDACQKWLL